MGKTRVLVSGAGGVGGVNFVRAIRWGAKQWDDDLFIVGTDYNEHYLLFPDVDVRYKSPPHRDPSFIPFLLDICEKHGVEFVHPHPSVEARVVSENRDVFTSRNIKLYLPRAECIFVDKLHIAKKLSSQGVPVPRTIHIKELDDVYEAFRVLGAPLWIRVRQGAGAKLALKVSSPEEAIHWIKLNVMQGRARVEDFIIQEYLPGRDLAVDCLMYKGRVVTCYARQRLAYPFKHVSLSGITGTPTIARIVFDDVVVETGIRAIRALDPEPHGFYSVDLKEGEDGKVYVTEVDGKWHTTAPLWGYAMSRVFNEPEVNIAYLYLALGLGVDPPSLPPRIHTFRRECLLIRHIDCGALLKCGDEVWRIL